jgi:sulfite exporter TauE/SafE
MARLILSCFLILTAIVLGLAGLGFGLYAAFISLASLMSPASAAAVIAAAAMMIAVAMVGIALRRSPAGQKAYAGAAATEAIDSLVNSLSQWVRSNPGEATAAALALGFVVGSRR